MKKMYKLSLVVALFFVKLVSVGQTCSILGTVEEIIGDKKQPISFANVLLEQSSTGTITDIDGKFEIKVNPGKYNLIFSFIGYDTDTIKDVVVLENEKKNISKSLKPSSVQMEEVAVVARANRESNTMLNVDRKASTSLVQNIGAQELSKKAASDVAEGLKKVVGLTVIGSKHLYIRGMGDRYNSAYLNGMPIPSPDPDNRVIPLNIFPTNVVRNLSVTKSFNPEFYGDFSGGIINIITKDFPEEKTIEVSLGTSINTQSSFRNFKSYNGGKSDFIGLDDGVRTTPNNIDKENYKSDTNKGLDFSSNFNKKSSTSPSNSSFQFLAGNKIEVTDNLTFGALGTINFSNNYGYNPGQLKRLNKQSVEEFNYNIDEYNYETSSSALGAFNVQFFKKHQLTYTFLLCNLSKDQFKDVKGTHQDYPDQIFSRRFTFNENKLVTHQVRGTHTFFNNDRLKLDWAYATNKAASSEPDRRQLVYLYDSKMDVYTFNTIDIAENHRFFNELKETESAMKGGLKYGMFYNGDEPARLTLKLGIQRKFKSRSFDSRTFVYNLQDLSAKYNEGINKDNPDLYLSEENFKSGLFSIKELTGVEASHKATLDVNAAHLSVDWEIVPNVLKIVPSVRLESSDQYILYRKQGDSETQAQRKSQLINAYTLPSLTIKYIPTEKTALNFSTSKTISRPGFKELAPFEYTEIFAGTKNRGNPNLVNGENLNADARFEIYPNTGELFAIGLFGKKLTDPIEKIQLASASGQLQSFQNSSSAHLGGIELEFTKNLGLLTKTESQILRNLTLNFNASYIYSQVSIDTTKKSKSDETGSIVLTNTKRPLQGASPYIINFDLNYEKWINPKFKGSITAAYNVFGKRVLSAGAQGLNDIYELPVNTLNLKVSGEFSEKFTVSITGKNLLNPTVKQQQEIGSSQKIINSYKTGVGIGLSLSYKIL